MSDCNCWECQLEKKHGGLDKIPEQEILDRGGCPYCAMTGYEDYPNNQIPCRLHGSLGQDIARVSRMMVEAARKSYGPEDGNCPYCFAEGKPVGIDCIHWVGLGWSKKGRSPEVAAKLNSLHGEKE